MHRAECSLIVAVQSIRSLLICLQCLHTVLRARTTSFPSFFSPLSTIIYLFRGAIQPKSATSSSASISQQFTEADAAELYTLAKANGDYLLRVPIIEADGSSTYAQTFVSACKFFLLLLSSPSFLAFFSSSSPFIFPFLSPSPTPPKEPHERRIMLYSTVPKCTNLNVQI